MKIVANLRGTGSGVTAVTRLSRVCVTAESLLWSGLSSLSTKAGTSGNFSGTASTVNPFIHLSLSSLSFIAKIFDTQHSQVVKLRSIKYLSFYIPYPVNAQEAAGYFFGIIQTPVTVCKDDDVFVFIRI